MTEPAPADSSMMFRLMVPRTSKENQKNGQESIEFAYNLQTDVPEDVVNDMVRESGGGGGTLMIFTIVHVHVYIHAYMYMYIYMYTCTFTC